MSFANVKIYLAKLFLSSTVLLSALSTVVAYPNATQSIKFATVVYDTYSYSPRKGQIRSFNIQTRQDSAFYPMRFIDQDVQPIVWSPDGEYLVARVSAPKNTPFYCILTQQGQQKSCLSEPAVQIDDWNIVREDDFVQWHDKKIRYLSQPEPARSLLPPNSEMTRTEVKLRVVEADPLSGKTLNVLYERAFITEELLGDVPMFSFSADGTHLFVGKNIYNTSRTYETNLSSASYLYNIHDKSERMFSVSQIRELFQITDMTPPPFICNAFTPRGTFIVLNRATHYVFLDKNLQFTKEIPHPPITTGTLLSCPYWSADESTIYVITVDEEKNKFTQTIYSYRFDKGVYVKRKTILRSGGWYTVYVPSPDGKQLAFTMDIPVGERNLPVAHILTESDELITLQHARNIVWLPVGLTPQPPPNIILPPAQPTLVNPLPGGGGE
jgi:hypothetical protein